MPFGPTVMGPFGPLITPPGPMTWPFGPTAGPVRGARKGRHGSIRAHDGRRIRTLIAGFAVIVVRRQLRGRRHLHARPVSEWRRRQARGCCRCAARREHDHAVELRSPRQVRRAGSGDVARGGPQQDVERFLLGNVDELERNRPARRLFRRCRILVSPTFAHSARICRTGTSLAMIVARPLAILTDSSPAVAVEAATPKAAKANTRQRRFFRIIICPPGSLPVYAW